MGLSDVQDATSLFESANDVLCFGVDEADMVYLKGIGVEVNVFDPLSGGMPDGKFNVLVVGREMSLFGLFGFIEKNMRFLLSNSRILARIDADGGLSDAKNVVAELAKPLSLQPEMYVEDSHGVVWLYLSRMR